MLFWIGIKRLEALLATYEMGIEELLTVLDKHFCCFFPESIYSELQNIYKLKMLADHPHPVHKYILESFRERKL